MELKSRVSEKTDEHIYFWSLLAQRSYEFNTHENSIYLTLVSCQTTISNYRLALQLITLMAAEKFTFSNIISNGGQLNRRIFRYIYSIDSLLETVSIKIISKSLLLNTSKCAFYFIRSVYIFLFYY